MAEGTGGGFNLQQFIEDSKNVLIAPKEYFTSMAKEGGLGEPIIKALIYGALAGVISMIWSIAGFGAMGGALGGAIGGGIGIMILVWAIIGAIIGLFIGGVIVLVISAICGGSTDFEANVRVTASMMVLSPINAVLGILAGIHFSIGALVSLLVSLYGLYLLYQALVNALGAKEGSAKVVSIVLAVIPALILASTLVCARAVTSTADSWKKQMETTGNKDAMKKLDQFRKQMEEAAKKNQ